ncbi:hypothetical protein SAMN05443247_02976 [Bradyrhizobium erythrophlei]|jgi:hypothetical protein|nr:hypothetical protein SAMN05443247_02976 [Bradyrhizobium erythrophlei]
MYQTKPAMSTCATGFVPEKARISSHKAWFQAFNAP